MIRVHRGPAPQALYGKRAIEVRRTIDRFYALDDAVRVQSRADLSGVGSVLKTLKSSLRRAFHNKCGFCETNLGEIEGDVESFRPKMAASDLKGSGSVLHYSWLALEWENVLLTCRICNVIKGNKFPVEGERAAPGLPIKDVREQERALLIDPTFGDPAKHLAFQMDGTVKPRTRRGEVTIEVVGLNRAALVEQRLVLIRQLEAVLGSRGSKSYLLDSLTQALSPEAPFAATARDFVSAQRSEITEVFGGVFPAPLRLALEVLPSGLAPAADPGSFGVQDRPIDLVRLRSRPLRRVEIRNFKLLRHLNLDFQTPSADGVTWLGLLGENGVGKTAVLQAVALALAGPGAARRYPALGPRRILPPGEDAGSITLRFWDSPESVVLRFDRRRGYFMDTPPADVLTIGYGAIRAPSRLTLKRHDGAVVKVDGLLKPITYLRSPQRWLLSLSPAQFDAVARVLKSTFNLAPDARLRPQGGQILVDLHGREVSFAHLSVGYRAVTSMVCDLLSVVFERWELPEAAEGLLLIDEPENHLHPRWKLRILAAFREAFPRLQGIVSTHDPLILRGLKDGEVRVLHADTQSGAVTESDLPPLSGLRVDQLLTTDAFGLRSTLDPQVEEDFGRYYFLLAKAARSGDEDGELEDLRNRLASEGRLGETVRERMMLEAIDEFLARTASGMRDGAVLDEETRTRLQAIWEGV